MHMHEATCLRALARSDLSLFVCRLGAGGGKGRRRDMILAEDGLFYSALWSGVGSRKVAIWL
eukprot:5469255-Amphidinium_carterae.2